MPVTAPPKEEGGPEELEYLHQVWNAKPAQIASLEARGICRVPKGRWSAAEEELLKANAAKAVQKYKTDDLIALSDTFKRKSHERLELYRMLGDGISRPINAIAKRYVRMNAEDHLTPYTAEDDKKLEALHKLHGPDWVKIGKLLGRAPFHVRDRYRVMYPNKSPWTPAEENKLAEIVVRLSGRPATDLIQVNEVSWDAVAAEMGNRVAMQCQLKWGGSLATVTCAKARGIETRKWTQAEAVALYKLVTATGETDAVRIDWVQLSKKFPGIRTAVFLRERWFRNVNEGRLDKIRALAAEMDAETEAFQAKHGRLPATGELKASRTTKKEVKNKKLLKMSETVAEKKARKKFERDHGRAPTAEEWDVALAAQRAKEKAQDAIVQAAAMAETAGGSALEAGGPATTAMDIDPTSEEASTEAKVRKKCQKKLGRSPTPAELEVALARYTAKKKGQGSVRTTQPKDKPEAGTRQKRSSDDAKGADGRGKSKRRKPGAS